MTFLFKKELHAFLVVMFTIGVNPCVANAQDGMALEEIIVTATKRAQSLQEVPIAVTAFSADTIEKTRMQNINDIASQTPNFIIGQQGPTAPELTIRGIGSTDRESGSDRSVVVFVDEVYIGRSGASTFDLFDLERIEVLRGPQGTLFGRNVVGGAISLITASPSQEFEAKIAATAGDRGLAELKGMINGGLSETVSGRASMSYKSQDGFYTNRRFNNRSSNDTESISARGKLKFDPSDNLSILVSADISSDTVKGVASKVTQGAASDADFVAALAPFGPFVPDADLFTVSNNKFGDIDRSLYSLTGRIDWFTKLGDVTIIPAFRHAEYDELRDIAGIGFSGTGTLSRGFESTAINDESYDALSFEARIASPVDSDSALSWIVGAYFLNEEIDREQIRERQANTAFSRPLFDQHNDASSQAIFGEFGYTFADRLTVTVGGRYTKDKKSFDMAIINTLSAAEQVAIEADLGRATSLAPALSEYSTAASDTWSEFTPKLTVGIDVTDGVMVFATLSEGFKSGGFVGLAATEAEAVQSFAPETARNTEVGIKGTFFDSRLQLSASFYAIDFEDLQLRLRILTIPGDVTSAVITIINAGEAEIDGVEFEFAALLADGFTLRGSFATLNTEIVGVTEQTQDVLTLGTDLQRAPDGTWNLSAEYETDVGGGALSIRAGYRYVGDHYFDLNEQASGFESGYGLLDGRIAYTGADDSWELSLWGKNLADESYRTHVQSIRAGRSGITQIGEPRTYGLTFTKWFGQ